MLKYGTFMTHRISVGDPAASSLCSCLRPFPGGFSLITETGQLRTYLVSHERQQIGSARAGSAKVVTAAPVRLCAPPPQGLFPLDEDIPVDHSWSYDGSLLVVLRRASFTAYWRQLTTWETASTKGEDRSEGRASSTAILGELAPLLDVVELYTGSNAFEGKAVACCLLGATVEGLRAGHPPAVPPRGKCDASKYLIAIGGTFGIECHTFEVPPPPTPGRNTVTDPPATNEKRKSQPQQQRQQSHQQKQQRRRRQNHQKAKDSKTQTENSNAHGGGWGEASSRGGQRGIMPGETRPATGCRQLAILFHGYHIVSIAISPDSGLMAAAAMTGHVKVWNVNMIGSSPLISPPPEGRKISDVEHGHGRWGFASNNVSEEIRPPQCGRGSDASELWGETLSVSRPTSVSFSPDDNASFALACWDGRVAIFLATQNSVDVGECEKRTAARGSRSWKRVWRETTVPAKIGGGKGGNLEDQDGAFLFWCKGPEDDSPADLVVSAYEVKIGVCARRGHSKHCALPPAPDKTTERRDLSQLFDHVSTTAPGFEVFEGGLGERVGGAVLGPNPSGLTRATVERYLIHGLAANRDSVALYDSNLCLHLVSLSTLLGVGRVIISSENSSAPDASETKGEAVSEAGENPTVLLMRKRTLVNNDHGLVVAEVGRHRGSESGGMGDESSEDLRISVIWRDARTGLEIPDHSGLGGEAAVGEFARLPFLPGELADGDDQRDRVLGADVRWGCLALFTRYTTLIYARPTTGAAIRQVSEAGQWKSYPNYPLVHGILIGGASTGPPFLTSDAPADLAGLYLLAILETNEEGSGGGSLFVRVQSLRDRSLTCQCKLDVTDGGCEALLKTQMTKVRVHVPPGSGGGSFVVITDAGRGACGTVRRGIFDEATLRLNLAPSRVITSSPWPPPETLRLEGAAGPNCELFLLKDMGSSRSEEVANNRVRWWITWPEMDVWKCVDAPSLIGGEDLDVCDFVKIFQLDMESVLQSVGK